MVPRWAPYVLLSLVLGCVLGFVIRRTGGDVVYSLDDPFIHLALSEQLVNGHYGINAEEPSSPSSSILWPFLLTPTARTGLHVYTPLAICWASAMGLVWGLRRLLQAAKLSDGTDLLGGLAPVILAVFLNTVGLVFLGMEHMMHVAVCVLVVAGLADVDAGPDGRLPWWLISALLVCPWLRYEGVALTLLGCLCLAWRGHARAGLLIGAASLIIVGLFSGFLSAVGLPLLPSSVLVKLASEGANPIRDRLFEMVSEPARVLTILLSASFAWVALNRRDPRTRGLALLAAGVSAAHAVAGKYGWFGRYGAYQFAVAWSVGVFVLRDPLRALVERRGQWAALGAFSVLCLPLFPYVVTTLRTPAAAADIYTQQHQMHRFATEFVRAPVAVNDLGSVAYRNPAYVLDLWGLGSDEARRARMNGGDADWMHSAALAHRVQVAMVYEDWFPELPAAWQRVGFIRNPTALEVSGSDTVSVWAVDSGYAESARRALRTFADTTPNATEVILEAQTPHGTVQPHH